MNDMPFVGFPPVDYRRPEAFQRIGKFGISTALIAQDPKTVRAILKDTIVVQATIDSPRGWISYIALHPDFELTEQMAVIPDYDANCAINEHGVISVVWQKARWSSSTL